MPEPISPVHAAIGAELRRLRRCRSLTQQQVADQVGLHRTYINQIEAGSRNVTVGVLAKLSYVFGERLSAVVSVADDAEPPSAPRT